MAVYLGDQRWSDIGDWTPALMTGTSDYNKYCTIDAQVYDYVAIITMKWNNNNNDYQNLDGVNIPVSSPLYEYYDATGYICPTGGTVYGKAFIYVYKIDHDRSTSVFKWTTVAAGTTLTSYYLNFDWDDDRSTSTM
jgi:hypothetical protein